MGKSKIQIIANPTARSGKARSLAERTLQWLHQQTDRTVNLEFTKGIHDAVRITRESIINGADMIVCVGGDGTLNEVANGFFIEGKSINPNCELGVINAGTGGGYARGLGIPASFEAQLELLLQPTSIFADVGRISYSDMHGQRVERLFLNECQVGIGSDVAAFVGKKFKFFGGPVAFGLTATYLALKAKPLQLTISYDDKEANSECLIGLVVGNGYECAGGMKLTPDARVNDGLLDVLSMHEMNIPQRLFNLSKVYDGKHMLSPHFSIRRCQKLTIETPQKIVLEADGEIFGYGPYLIDLLPSSLRVISGTTYKPTYE